MTKEELILKWQKEADEWNKAKHSESFNTKTKEMAYNRQWQLLHCIEALKNLDVNTVKFCETCPLCGRTDITNNEDINLCYDCDHTWVVG